MKISCEEAATICHKSQYREAGFWDKILLRLHMYYCKNCSQFVRKNSRLTSLCKKAQLKALTEQEKEEIRKNLKQTDGGSAV